MTGGGLWHPAYIGVGSNLDGPERQLRRAFEALASMPGTASFRHSALYRSAPVGPPGQPDYLNAVGAFLTRLPPLELLARLQALEDGAGRDRAAPRWGPRTLDLDLLVFGALTLDGETLTIPHPRIHERNFVLLPLAEIAPHLEVPGRGSVLRLLGAIGADEPRIERLEQAGR